MKKLLLGIGLLFCGIGAQAQELARPLSLGPKLGVNMANVWSEQESNTDPVFGAVIGGVANLRFTKRHAIQAELVYSGKGFKQPAYTIKNTLSYLELPFFYQRHFLPGKKGGHLAEKRSAGNIYTFFGPQLSVLLSSKAAYKSPEYSPANSTASVDVYPWTRPFDMSAVLGLGYEMKNGLSFDVRYVLGLRHLHGERHVLIPTDVSMYTFQAGVAYLLPIKFK